MSTFTNYSLGRAARVVLIIGMIVLALLCGGVPLGAPASAAAAAPAGDASVAAAVAHHHHGKHEVTLQAPSSATKGEKVPLKGKVKKTHHHKTRVTIQEKHGKTWKPLGHTTTSKKGTFKKREVLKGKTKVTIRATAKGHGTSATRKVTLTKASNGTPAQPGQSGPSGVTPGGGNVTPQDNSPCQVLDGAGQGVAYVRHVVGSGRPLEKHKGAFGCRFDQRGFEDLLLLPEAQGLLLALREVTDFRWAGKILGRHGGADLCDWPDGLPRAAACAGASTQPQRRRPGI